MLLETLVSATDLDNWAERLDARGMLPKLIRRLIYATSGQIDQVEFPSDEAIQLGGWDGILKVKAENELIPDGLSGWELGTNRDVKGKADSDYEKRKLDGLGLNPPETTFVFVTLRRWGGKDKWVKARRSEGFWRDVIVYDADDLAAWLERAQGVHLWLSILVGKHPDGATDIRNFWDGWADATSPRMSAELMISGRLNELDQILTWLLRNPSSLGLQADSRDEALAFFAAALETLPEAEREPYLARSIVVEDISSWRQLSASTPSLILIPLFDGRQVVTSAVKQGHHVLIPLGRDEPNSSTTVAIPRLQRHHAKHALLGMGLQEERADDLATLVRRSMMALRRKLAISPEVQRPEWAKPLGARTLLAAMLVGGGGTTRSPLTEMSSRGLRGSLTKRSTTPSPRRRMSQTRQRGVSAMSGFLRLKKTPGLCSGSILRVMTLKTSRMWCSTSLVGLTLASICFPMSVTSPTSAANRCHTRDSLGRDWPKPSR